MKINKYNGVRNKKAHQEALKRLEELMNLHPQPESDEGKELNLLGVLIENYEDVRYPIVSKKKKSLGL